MSFVLSGRKSIQHTVHLTEGVHPIFVDAAQRTYPLNTLEDIIFVVARLHQRNALPGI